MGYDDLNSELDRIKILLITIASEEGFDQGPITFDLGLDPTTSALVPTTLD